MYKQIAVLDESAMDIVVDIVKADEPNLIPENIKKDVDILGVIGTYGGETSVQQP